MKLRHEFEAISTSLLDRNLVAVLDQSIFLLLHIFSHIFEASFEELLREEQRLNTQNIMDQSHIFSNTIVVAYVAYGKGKSRDMSTT